MSAAYAMLVEEFSATGLGLSEAIQRADEALMPERERKALENRRALRSLIGMTKGTTTDRKRLGVRRRRGRETP